MPGEIPVHADREQAEIIARRIVIAPLVAGEALPFIGREEDVALHDEAVLILLGGIEVPADEGGEEARPAELGARVDGPGERLFFGSRSGEAAGLRLSEMTPARRTAAKAKAPTAMMGRGVARTAR